MGDCCCGVAWFCYDYRCESHKLANAHVTSSFRYQNQRQQIFFVGPISSSRETRNNQNMIMPTRTSSNSSSIRRFLIRRQQQQHQCSIRWLAKSSASTTSPPSATHAFDRNIKTLQRENAARAHQRWNQPTTSSSFTSLEPTESSTAATANNNNTTVTYDYLREEIAHRLIERLDDIRRVEGFPLALDLGSGPGYIHKAICAGEALHGMEGGIGGIRKLVQLDSSHNMLHRDTEQESFPGSDLCQTYRLCADEEQPLPFPDETFDIVISSASMHWINELPSVLQEIRRVLKPDGCFVLAMIGGSTLCELRASLVLAEMEREGVLVLMSDPFVSSRMWAILFNEPDLPYPPSTRIRSTWPSPRLWY